MARLNKAIEAMFGVDGSHELQGFPDEGEVPSTSWWEMILA